MAWIDSWVSFDTETTGFSSEARVLELAVVYFEHGKPVETWSSFFNPPELDWLHPAVLDAQKVNGITKEMCEGAPSFREAIGDIMARLEVDVWVAHNLNFDKRMLGQEFQRAGYLFDHQPVVEVCTMCSSYQIHPSAQSHSLGATAERWGVIPESAHRAAVDAVATGQILQKMIESGHLPIPDLDVVSFQKEASVAWNRRPRRR